MLRHWVVLGILTFLLISSTCKADCRIEYDEGVTGEHHHPMIVIPGEEKFLYPILEGEVKILQIPSGKRVYATCPGNRNSLLVNSLPKTFITCSRGKLYDKRRVVRWPQLGCKSKPSPSLTHYPRTRCGSFNNGTVHHIHWPIRKDVDIVQIRICFDEEKEEALFTDHQIHGEYTYAKTVGNSRPTFKKKGMISISADRAYAKRTQNALFKQLLGSDRHLTGLKEHYLARGHLTPDSDFVLEPEQDATYYYANVVPQWQAVNNGNWKSLENSVRELAEKRRTVLDVRTGVHGILHLPDTRNNMNELFLGRSVGKRVIPVPALMWKVIHDPSRNEAIAIVQVNDIGGLGLAGDLSLYEAPCSDMCPKISWVDWDVLDTSSGRTYCCTIQDLRGTIHNIPDLKNVNILASVK